MGERENVADLENRVVELEGMRITLEEMIADLVREGKPDEAAKNELEQVRIEENRMAAMLENLRQTVQEIEFEVGDLQKELQILEEALQERSASPR